LLGHEPQFVPYSWLKTAPNSFLYGLF
jgi:hypothetical protein